MQICKELGIEDINSTVIPKSEIKEAINKHHNSDMIDIYKTKTKLDAIKVEVKLSFFYL